jgi:hypothetical protein
MAGMGYASTLAILSHAVQAHIDAGQAVGKLRATQEQLVR